MTICTRRYLLLFLSRDVYMIAEALISLCPWAMASKLYRCIYITKVQNRSSFQNRCSSLQIYSCILDPPAIPIPTDGLVLVLCSLLSIVLVLHLCQHACALSAAGGACLATFGRSRGSAWDISGGSHAGARCCATRPPCPISARCSQALAPYSLLYRAMQVALHAAAARQQPRTYGKLVGLSFLDHALFRK